MAMDRVLANSGPEHICITKQRGSFWVVAASHRDFWETVSNGSWEPETYQIFEKFLDKKHSYIDMGTWIGPTLLYGAQLSRIAIGIEPDPIAYDELARNVALNAEACGNVKVFNCCIARTSGSVPFGSRGAGGDSMSSLLFADGATRWTVEGLTFEDFIRRCGVEDCTFIKIDIEGGEYAILPTMANYLRRFKPTLYLSLHPFFLSPGDARGRLAWLWQRLSRLAHTGRLLFSLRMYKYLYDVHGNRLSKRRVLRQSVRGNGCVLVATDRVWGE